MVVFEKLVEGANLTCADLMDQASGITDPTSEDCAKMQREGLALCSCPAPEDAAPFTLCQGGAEFDASIEFIKDWSCGTISTYVSSDTRPNACAAYQSTIGVYCGCPYDTIEAGDVQVCNLCGQGNLLPEPGRFVQRSGGQDENACANLEFEASRVYDTCQNITATYGEACCKPTPEGAPALGDVVTIEDGADGGGSTNDTAPAPEEKNDKEEQEEMNDDTTSTAATSLAARRSFIAFVLNVAVAFFAHAFPLL